MATYYDTISPEQVELLERAPLFFIASADPELAPGPDGVGPLNLSPKGGVPLHVLSPREIAYLDYPGSGNETARHSVAGGPVTLMACSFDEADAAIVRIYGTARVLALDEAPFADRLLQHTAPQLKKPRQAIVIDVDRTMTSCGYGVPVLELVRQREKSDRGRRYK